MNINIPFEFKEKVWYVWHYWSDYYASEGNIFGISIFNRNNGNDIRIIFKNDSVPIEHVFKTKEEADKKIVEIKTKQTHIKE